MTHKLALVPHGPHALLVLTLAAIRMIPSADVECVVSAASVKTSNAWGPCGTNANLCVIYDHTTARFIVDAEGDAMAMGNFEVGTAGKGIDFSTQTGPATGMTSELLDRYEEGTWAPVMTDGTNPVTMNSGTLVGTYTRVGNQVTATTGYIEATSLASASGALLITGLPFAAASDNKSYAAATVGWAANLAITSGTAMSGEVRKAESKVRLHLWDGTGGPTEFQASELSANGALVVTVTYLTST